MPSQSETISAKRAPRTLAAELRGIDLKPQERRAVLAADAMPVRMHRRRVLVAADIFIRDGGFRARDVLGITMDEAVNARDLVRTVPTFIALESVHQQLKKPNVAEVAVYKRAKKTRDQITRALGIDRKEVDKINEQLTDLGIGRKTVQTEEFEKFCKLVEKSDKNHAGSPITSIELGKELGVSGVKVGRARRRNRMRLKASAPTKDEIRKEVREKTNKIKKAMLLDPKLSDATIVEKLKAEGLSNITENIVMHVRQSLVSEGSLQRRRTLKKQMEGPPSTMEEVESYLRNLLPTFPKGKKPVLAALRREHSVLQKVSLTSFQDLCRRILSEQSTTT